MLVPDLIPLSDIIRTPGADRSVQEPKLVKDAGCDRWSWAATEKVKSSLTVADAGDVRQASWFELPAASAKNTPGPEASLTAALNALDSPPPRDMFTTHGRPVLLQCATAREMPSTIPRVEPEPVAPRTLKQ